MSSDYQKGYRGEPGVNTFDYAKGQADRAAGLPEETLGGFAVTTTTLPVGGGAADLTGNYEAGVAFGREWVKNPDRLLKHSIIEVLVLTILGGVVGFAVGQWLHDDGLWLVYTKAWFWFVGMIFFSYLLGVTIVGRATRRGTLTILFLGGILGYMAWTYVLYPVVFIHIK